MISTRTLCALGALLLLGLLGARGSSAQAPLTFVNDSTSVRSVAFRFSDSQTFRPSRLAVQIATTAPGFFQSGWRASILSALPVFKEPGAYPFSPVVVHKDLVRLERFYDRNGFINAAADYEAQLDTTVNAIDLTFLISEGDPLLIDSLVFAGPGGRPPIELLDEEVREGWRDFRNRATLRRGERLDEFKLVQLQDEAIGWLRDHGYAFADASVEVSADSSALKANVRVKINPGPRGRFGEITVEGVESVEPLVVLRELPFEPGDLFRQRDLTEGQRQVFGLNLFQLATVGVGPDQPRDSSVAVTVRVREGAPRFLTALTGYYSDGGLTSSAQWTHRNFFGGARSFTASLRAQSGIGAVGNFPIEDYEARLSLRQPYLFDRRLSGTVEPFVRYRDDVVEVSTQYAVTTSLVYELGPLRTTTLSATLSTRTVGSEVLSLEDPATLLPGDRQRIDRSQMRLSAILGTVDNPLNPRSGIIIRPSAAVAGPPFTETEYAAGQLSVTGFVPFGEAVGLVVRGEGGALVGLGGSDPGDPEDFLALRNELFFAGGTTDVRGWSTNLLGPKFIDFSDVDSSGVFTPETPLSEYYTERYRVRYRPVGAESKASLSVQLNLPLPLGEPWGASIFADAGRVWRPATGLYELFSDVSDELPNLNFLTSRFREEVETIRYGVGAGIQYQTPVGFLTIALGVKLNPSFFDLRDPQDILIAADIENLAGTPPDFSRVEEIGLRRIQFHFALGQRF